MAVNERCLKGYIESVRSDTGLHRQTNIRVSDKLDNSGEPLVGAKEYLGIKIWRRLREVVARCFSVGALEQ